MFKRGDIILFIGAVSVINILAVLQINSTFFILGLAQIAFALLLLVTFIYSIVRTTRDKRQMSVFKRLRPLLFELVLTLTIPLVSFFIDTDGGKRNIIKAGVHGNLTFVHLDLREDGSFKLTNSGPFGGQHYRGKYTLHNDTLHLDNGDTNLYPLLSFVIKLDTVRHKKYFDPIRFDTTKEAAYKLYIDEDNSPGIDNGGE